ncbi:MAG: heparinase II/III family protein [Cohnella sp.]|nr:heparinase II/III family protein [Cohnella sp.]
MGKKGIVCFCLVALIFTSLLYPYGTVRADSPPTVNVYANGLLTNWYGQQPILSGGSEVLVPLASFAAQVGWMVQEEPGVATTEAVKLFNNAGTFVEIKAADGEIVFDGHPVQTAIDPYVLGSNIMMPLATVAQLLNAQFEWDTIGHAAYFYSPIFTGYANKWAVMPETTEAPAIDGTMNEALWNHAAVLDRFVTVTGNVYAEPGPQVKVAYDDQHLYLGVRLSSALGDDTPGQRGFHVMLSAPAAPGGYVDIPVVVENGNARIIPSWGPGIATASNVVTSTSKETHTVGSATYSTWTSEISLPLDSVQQGPVAPGDEWGINVLAYRIVDHHPIFQTWYPVLRSFEMNWAADDYTQETYNFRADVAQEGRFGRLFFQSLPQPASGEHVLPWQPEDVRLEYNSFTQLGLSFREPAAGFEIGSLALEWKSPSGERTPLTDVMTTKVNDRIVVSLAHPNPAERGMYELELTLLQQGETNSGLAVLSFDGQQLIEAGMRAFVHRLAPSTSAKQHVAFGPASPNVQTLLGLIPDRVGLYYLGDPTRADLAPRTLYTWSAAAPDVVTSTVSGLSFPNASYLETNVLSVKDRNGQTVDYPYYMDAGGKKYFFSAQVWYKQREYVIAQIKTLAVTDPVGAARLLLRFAETYEKYVPVNDYLWNQYPIDASAGAPAVYWGGTWSFWYYTDLPSIANLLAAYQTVKQTDAFEQLSAQVGENVERKIVDKMFKPTAEHDRSFSIANGNYDYQLWLGYLSLAKAIGEPDYVHDTVTLMNDYLNSTYLSDGFFQEVTISYHDQSTNGFNGVSDQMKTWVDPAGYTSPRTGIRLDNPDIAQQFPILGKAKQISQTLVYPNGYVVPLNDTWAYSRRARIETGSLLLPAAGVARFSRNSGTDESQLYLKFSPNYGHYHNDPLNLTLFADGQELLPDIGYTHTFYRYPSIATIGHNTVLVDSKDMSATASKEGGNLELFAPIGPTLQIMRARQENAYPGLEQYEREPWSIGLPNGDGKDSYVVDVFRVSGGSRHEYTLQGDANHDAAFTTTVPMSVYGDRLLPAGTNAVEAATELEIGSAEGQYAGYIYVKDVKQADIADGKYEVDLATADDNAQPMSGMKITGFTGDGASKLFLGTYPSVRASRLDSTKDTNAEAVKYKMPKLVVRRDGTALKSTFTTVMEPYTSANGPVIEEAQVLNADANETGNVALQLAYGDYTDIVLSANDPEETFTVGDLTLRGKAGFIRMKNGAVETMTLVGGTLLKKGTAEVAGSGTVSGAVYGVQRIAEGAADNALVTDTEVPQVLVGQYVFIDHPDNTSNGYKIKAIQTANHRSTIVLDDMDPGFRIAADGSSRMTSFPFKQWSGTHRFYIDNVSSDIGAGTLQLVPERSAMTVGERIPAALTLTSGTGAPIDLALADSIAYDSSDTGVVTVDADADGNAHVNAVAPGTALITATLVLNGVVTDATVSVSVTETGYPIRTWTPVFTDTHGTTVSALTGLTMVRTSVQVKNVSGDTKPVTLLVTLCDSNGNALAAPVTSGSMVISGATVVLSADADVSAAPGGAYLKVLVWDTETGMQPYADELHLPN